MVFDRATGLLRPDSVVGWEGYRPGERLDRRLMFAPLDPL